MVSQRVLLVDTDVLVLLGASETLPTVLEKLGFKTDEVRRLAAATSQLERGARFKATYSGAALQAALQTARTITPLLQPPADASLVDGLAAVSGIDLGEAELLALLSEQDGYFLTTGDKRALIAVATNPLAAAVRDRVRGRLICLESLLKLLVQTRGAKSVAQAFAGLMTHRTIGVLLTEPQVRSDEICLEGIESFLRDLVRATGEGFLFLP